MTNWADPFLKMKQAYADFALYFELGETERAMGYLREGDLQRDWLDIPVQQVINARELRERASRPATQSCGDTAVREDE